MVKGIKSRDIVTQTILDCSILAVDFNPFPSKIYVLMLRGMTSLSVDIAILFGAILFGSITVFRYRTLIDLLAHTGTCSGHLECHTHQD